ncbi:hypothetical protein C1637_18890 [Chryseobacterium lactis]|uniref:DUF4870 domain-containing protein n=1 Tax=Chryseobacterium lactis TaxID=1241981 RepID=A0A3G6RQB7_CHRLC|nr:hypothetical protein [Chryseobacterium lactis]AZA84849.1 hypothetical protein EG342_24400 [Chryseobacterium lactis]AZB05237.1 hypothetical protein EG341_15280 [Chryseobacterium lactis]PNW12220.1 hypothetical protein C1637_18890 [Chryseobacterium lactis]
MMEFSFNTFFGLEREMAEHPEMVIFGALLFPLVAMFPIALIGWIFRKLKLNMYLIHALLYTLMFTFLLGVLTIFILYFITDKNAVKLIYCWLAVFTGMFFFSLINTNTITKMFTDWSKIIKEKEGK